MNAATLVTTYAASHTPMAGQQVIIDFAQVGTAGPFPVVNGHVKLPDATMQDLARMLRPTYEMEQQAVLKAAPGELAESAAKGAIMGAAYDFRDAHISGSMNLKRSAHAALEAAVDSALVALATPQQEVSQDTMYLLRRLLSNQHTLTGPEFRAELEKIVGEAYQQEAQEPAGEVVSASCDHATVRWLRQTSSVGGGDPRNSRSWPITGDKVYLAPQQEAPDSGSCTDGNTPGLMPADAELLAHIKEAVPGLTRANTALMVAKAVLEKFGSRRVASEVK